MNLIRIELRKMKMGWYVRGALIANLIIMGFLWLISYSEKADGGVSFQSMEEAFLIIGTFVRSVFIIFGAVLIAKLVISEYKNKTILVMFTYPISRKKLLTAKLMIAAGLTFITILLSNILIAAVFFGVNSIYHFIPDKLTSEIISQQAVKMAVFTFGAAGTSLVPIFFGMRKHSVPATIISSIVIVTLTSQTSPGFSISSVVYIPLFLAALGFIFSCMAIRNVDKQDA
ncbi:ABC transporter permease [Bacillus stercoris]|uniref:ABC transporter permease n=1 Tax=Bacillus stercoris TaxID=2054641 RepID=UPI001FB34ED6|nr:ABC transporter permease [Bacillus stercoris]